MRYFLAVLAVFVLLASFAPAEVIQNEKIEGGTILFADWDGDTVLDDIILCTGYLHAMMSQTIDNQGGIHLKTQIQPMGLKGEGLITGEKYVATGGTKQTINANKGESFTYVNNYKLIGQGNAPNYLVHVTYHVTINANGDLIVEQENATLKIQ